MPADPSSQRPERVGRYEVLLPIASGGMATVYLARSLGVAGFEREVALKLTHAHLRENRDFASDLIEEGKLAVRIRHPNVVSVLDVGEDVDGLFLVMEYVEGDTLAALLAEGAKRGSPLSWRVGLRILLDALAGLQAAHDLRDASGRPVGLVHRDFSPQNVLVGTDGIGRLTDFGIAKAVTRLGHTSTGVVKGKLAYMSPEQARGAPLDRRSDVWAAGVVAWETLASRRLYPGEEAATLLRIVSETPEPLSSVVPDIPSELGRVVAQALEPDRNKRWAAASAFARAIQAAAQPLELIATPDEVAEAVNELVADKLERRRMQVLEIIELRTRLTAAQTVTPDSETASNQLEPTDDASSSTTVRSSLGPDSGVGRGVWLGAGALVVAGLIGLLIARRAPDQTAAAVVVIPSGEASAEAPALPATSAPPAHPPSMEFLSITSDVALESLQVEGKNIPLPASARTLGIQVSSEELDRGVAVEAVATDGRKLRVIGESGQHVLKLRFQAGRAPVGTSQRPAHLPFAPNPYGANRP